MDIFVVVQSSQLLMLWRPYILGVTSVFENNYNVNVRVYCFNYFPVSDIIEYCPRMFSDSSDFSVWDNSLSDVGSPRGSRPRPPSDCKLCGHNCSCVSVLNSSFKNLQLRDEETLLKIIRSMAENRRHIADSSHCQPRVWYNKLLPPTSIFGGHYATKIFVAGFPKQYLNDYLASLMSVISPAEVQFPQNKDKSYVHLVFHREVSVQEFLSMCTYCPSSNDFRFGLWVNPNTRRYLQVSGN